MITAYALRYGPGERDLGLYLDRARADNSAARMGGTVHKLVEEAAILRKFDAYVPADQASSMRYRILELEAQVAELRAQVFADNNEILDLREKHLAQPWQALPNRRGSYADGGIVPGAPPRTPPLLPGEVLIRKDEGPWLCLLCKSGVKGRHGLLDDRKTPCPNGTGGPNG